MIGIYVAGDSGAYLNPGILNARYATSLPLTYMSRIAITFGSCLYRKLPWRRFPIYFIAQLLGAYVGSG